MSIQKMSLLLLVIFVAVTSTQKVSLTRNQRLMAKIDQLTNRVGSLEEQLTKRVVKRQAGQMGCDSGSFDVYHYPKAPDYPAVKKFRFKVPFERTPAFVYGASKVDAYHGHNLRYSTSIRYLDRYGFTIYGNQLLGKYSPVRDKHSVDGVSEAIV